LIALSALPCDQCCLNENVLVVRGRMAVSA
jgi:hypothetical protein